MSGDCADGITPKDSGPASKLEGRGKVADDVNSPGDLSLASAINSTHYVLVPVCT